MKGHKDFVPAMISRGAASADSAMIILDSSLGNFEAGFERRGQTREHLIILRALGCRKGTHLMLSIFLAVYMFYLLQVRWSLQ